MIVLDELPVPEKNTLLLVAVEKEISALLPAEKPTPIWTYPESPDVNPMVAWRWPNLTIAITGPGGPNHAAVCTALIANAERNGVPYARLMNFGGVGAYDWSGLDIGDTVFIDRSKQWNFFYPSREWAWYTETISGLEVPEGWTGRTCLSGSLFSTDRDRQFPVFLTGDVEEYELYALSRIGQCMNLPVTSIKFVTNPVGPDGGSVYLKNLPDARKTATKILKDYLAGSLQPPSAYLKKPKRQKR